MPIRLLFLNTRDTCGADVAVHLSLMAHLPATEVEIFAISNSEAADAQDMGARLRSLPNVSSRFLPLGRPSHALSGRGPVGKALAFAPSLASLLKIAAFIRRHRIQVIHSTDRPRDASYTSLLGRLTGAVAVVHQHAPVSELSRPTLWGLRNATGIFAVSDFTKSCLVDLGMNARKIHTIHNAVDTEFFDPDTPALRPPLRAQFGIPTDAPLVGIAARMNPWKGQRELITALALLRGKLPDLHALIVGADVPDERLQLEKIAREGGVADRIHFGGFQQDVRPFLRELDLFVHPSYGEPFGLAIVEAMAMRKPVVACNTGGVPEIITHGADGWLVEERSAVAVAAAITTLLTDVELSRHLGQHARKTVLERFTPRHQCAAVVQQYVNLTEAA